MECIEREDALKVIETANSMASSFLERTMELCVIMDRIAAADVVPVRHGRWTLLVSLNGDEHDKWKCSECGHYTRNGADRNYCPNCGAKMDKGGDGD